MNKSFLEYLDAKGKLKEKPHVAVLADKLEVEPSALTPAAKNKKVKGKHDQVKEYFDDKGKIVEKPATEIVPDYKGPNPYAPPKSTGMSEPKPYRNGKNQSAEPSEAGLGDKGDNKLIYKPDISKGTSNDVPGGKAVKTQTEQFLNKTKSMTTQEFVEFMRTKVNPAVNEGVRNIISLVESDVNSLDKLVSELKRAGKLPQLVNAILTHKESFHAIAGAIREDAGQVRSLWTAISEIVGPPVGMDDVDMGDEGEEEDPMNPKKKHPGEEEDEFADDSEEMEDDGMDFGHGDEEEGEGEESEEEPDMGMEDEMGDEEMGGEEGGPPPEGMDGPPPPHHKNPFLPKKFM
jgi:hypothetical protein